MSISKNFIPNFVRVLTNKRKYIDQNFHSVAGVMSQGWDLWMLEGQKLQRGDLRWCPNRLRILVSFVLMCKLSSSMVDYSWDGQFRMKVLAKHGNLLFSKSSIGKKRRSHS